MRIVVVEDEERPRIGLSHLIESIDETFKVVGMARNGQDGIEMIRRLIPDLAFVDIRMPVMDGLTMIETLLRESRKTCAFVIVSAYSDFDYARKALRYGVADYILKPVTYEDVEGTLRKLSGNLSANPYEGGSIDEKFPRPAEINPLVSSVLDSVRDGYSCPLSLDGVASQLNVTPEYLSQLFSKQMNVTFTTYIKTYRVDVAKRLLLENRWRVQDVANMVGYQNVKYFHRVFREITDMTPTEFGKRFAIVTIKE